MVGVYRFSHRKIAERRPDLFGMEHEGEGAQVSFGSRGAMKLFGGRWVGE
jgi:hypothetical protein